MSRGRDTAIDAAKGVAILLVLLGHAIAQSGPGFATTPGFLIVYSVHMPLFAYLSGLVTRRIGEPVAFLKDRAVRLLVPYVSWGIVVFLIRPRPLIPYVNSLLLGPVPGGVLWFLYALWLCCGVLVVCELFRGGWRLAMAISCVGIFAPLFVPIPALASQVAWLFPFFAGGYYLKASHFGPVALLAGPFWIAAALMQRPVDGAPAFYWRLSAFMGGIPGAFPSIAAVRYIAAAFGIVFLIAFVRLMPEALNRLLALLGHRSLGLYAANGTALVILLALGASGVGMLFIGSLAIALEIVVLCERFLWTRRLLLGSWKST